MSPSSSLSKKTSLPGSLPDARAVFAALELLPGRGPESVVRLREDVKCNQENKKSRRETPVGDGGVSAEKQGDLTARRETLTPHRVVFARGPGDKTRGQDLFVRRQEDLMHRHDVLAPSLVFRMAHQDGKKTRQEASVSRLEDESDRHETLKRRQEDLTPHLVLCARPRVFPAAPSEVLMRRSALLARGRELSMRHRELPKAHREDKKPLRSRPAPLSFLFDPQREPHPEAMNPS
jgi:hypothetical protein